MIGLIMVGGRGTRFWPLSTKKTPKQLIDFNGSGPMIKVTVDRLKPIIDNKNFFIVTSKTIVKPMKKILPEIPNIIGEPEGKNTAPCIAMITGMLLKENSEEVMGVFPGDHFIMKPDEFIRILTAAEKAAVEKNALVTIGIKPEFAHTGYGYIEYVKDGSEYCRVIKFYEKPDKSKAESFIEAGNYLWNAGIFVWKVKIIAEEFRKYQPKMYESLIRISEASPKKLTSVIKKEYSLMQKISIDYAIMEKSDNIFTLPASIGWNDVGSWTNISSVNKLDENNNSITAYAGVIINSSNNVVNCAGKTVALVGVENLIVVENNGSILICNRNNDQLVGKIPDILEQRGLGKYI